MESAIPKTDRNWAMACHLSTLVGYFFIPFGHIIAPLIIWLIKKEDSPFVDDQGKESLNFQISMTIYAVISGILVFVLIGFLMLAALYLMEIICVVIAAVKANDGEKYRYPLTIRFLK